MTYLSDIAFTETVKAEQSKRGSRSGYEKMSAKRDWQSTVSPDLAEFLLNVDSFYLATATVDGQPYIQHRGGPKGFLKPIDEKTLAFADYSGNRQYISVGNLAENDKAHIFLMDYANRRRIKIWGHARVVEDDPELLERLIDNEYKARPERAIVFEISAWDVNCPQHIPLKFDLQSIEKTTHKLVSRVQELEAEISRLKACATCS